MPFLGITSQHEEHGGWRSLPAGRLLAPAHHFPKPTGVQGTVKTVDRGSARSAREIVRQTPPLHRIPPNFSSFSPAIFCLSVLAPARGRALHLQLSCFPHADAHRGRPSFLQLHPPTSSFLFLPGGEDLFAAARLKMPVPRGHFPMPEISHSSLPTPATSPATKMEARRHGRLAPHASQPRGLDLAC